MLNPSRIITVAVIIPYIISESTLCNPHSSCSADIFGAETASSQSPDAPPDWKTLKVIMSRAATASL